MWTPFCPTIPHKNRYKGQPPFFYENKKVLPSKLPRKQTWRLSNPHYQMWNNSSLFQFWGYRKDAAQCSDIHGCLAKKKANVSIFQRAFEIREELLQKSLQLAQTTSAVHHVAILLKLRMVRNLLLSWRVSSYLKLDDCWFFSVYFWSSGAKVWRKIWLTWLYFP